MKYIISLMKHIYCQVLLLFRISDRKAVSAHLPLASTKSTPQEKERLVTVLEEMALKFKP